MHKVLVLLAILSSAVTVRAATLNAPFANVSSLTFTQASSAKTGVPNVRVGAQIGRYARGLNGTERPGTALNSVSNYYMTKAPLHILLGNAVEWEVAVDQDTNVYLNGGANLIKIPSGTRWGTGVYR